jgi:hypothetical protein
MVTIEQQNLVDKALEYSSHEKFTEEDARAAISCLALALKILIHTLAAEVGDHK